MNRTSFGRGLSRAAMVSGTALTLFAMLLMIIPDVDARRGGGRDGGSSMSKGSIRHSGGSRASVQPSRSSTSRKSSPGAGTQGRKTSPAKGTPGRSATPARSTGARAQPGGSSRGKGRAASGRGRGKSSHYRGNKRYSARKDARRDYRRWRRRRALFALGVAIATRPRYSTTVVVTGTSYYYWGGTYYAASGSGYVVVAPPPGAVVHAVPTYTTVVYVRTTPYYYYGGSYYVATTAPAPPPAEIPEGVEMTEEEAGPPMTQDDHNYEVVGPPVGVTVPYLPDEAEMRTINSTVYYAYDGTYYRPFVGDGDTIYQVVEDPTQG